MIQADVGSHTQEKERERESEMWWWRRERVCFEMDLVRWRGSPGSACDGPSRGHLDPPAGYASSAVRPGESGRAPSPAGPDAPPFPLRSLRALPLLNIFSNLIARR